MSDSSVDGDEAPPTINRDEPDDASCDGDDGVFVQPRRRGPAQPVQPQAPVTDASRYPTSGKPMCFFMFACDRGLWATDFAEMDINVWANDKYGDNNNFFIGAVLGHWQFVSGDVGSADRDEGIFIDLARLHHKGGHGVIVYKALQSFMLDDPPQFEYPTSTFKVLRQFGQHLCKLCTSHSQFEGSKTVKQQLREWQTLYEVALFPMHVVRFCPKAAVMAISGWDVWHAVPVSRAHRGTNIIGAALGSLEVYFTSGVSHCFRDRSVVGYVAHNETFKENASCRKTYTFRFR